MGAAPQRRAEDVGDSEATLVSAAFDASPEALAILEAGRILHANAAFADLFGTDLPSDLLACSRGSARADGECAGAEEKDPGWSSHGTRLCYFPCRKRNGSVAEIEATCSPTVWQGRCLRVVSLRDVSQRERRRAVRDSEQRCQAIFRASAMGILQCSRDGHVMESNPAAENLLGYTGQELRGRQLSSFTHSQDLATEEALFRELAQGARESYQVEVRYVGQARRTGWVRRSVSLVRSGGKPQAAIVMMEDITERKRAEQQLRDAQKMEAVGRLVGGVAHDFNNLLTGIMLYCDLLLAGLERDSRLGHHAEEIRLTAEQGAALIQQLLAIARQQVVEPRLLSLNHTVTKTHNLLARLIGESIQFRMHLAEDLGEIRMDPAQVQQILFNLVLNARDAMPQGGRIEVETANCDFEPSAGSLPAGGQVSGVQLTVRDNGSGMSSDTLAHLFEPFFTTKKAGRGNGLGLATVHDIVQNNGGSIAVESEVGRGTVVRVILPRVLEPSCEVPEIQFSEKATGEMIVLLEDNATIRHAAERILSECGYRVLEAATGTEALALAESFPGTVDLLLADVDLPGMSGRDVARRLSATRPGLKSLYMSGYKPAEDDDPGTDDSVVFFQKPFTGAVLLQRVREILDAKSPSRSREKRE